MPPTWGFNRKVKLKLDCEQSLFSSKIRAGKEHKKGCERDSERDMGG